MRITLKGSDLIALVLIVGAFVMIGLGHNSVMEFIIIGIGVSYGVLPHVKLPTRKQ